MLINSFRRHLSKIKQLGRKSEDKQDVHAIKAEEMLESEDQKSQKELFKDHQFTSKWMRFRTNKLDCRRVGLTRYPDDPQTFRNIPKLHHGLQKVLKGGLFKQDFGIKHIYQPEEVEGQRLNLYRPPTKDPRLFDMAKRMKARYIMSTSTIGSAMSHLCFILGCFRSPRFDMISTALDPEPKKLMISLRKPVTFIFRKVQGDVYGIDSDKGMFEQGQTILMNLGKIMESQLTTSNQHFRAHYVKSQLTQQFTPELQHHRFMLVNNEICLRSQIDCVSYDQNGNPFVFEIKTRATSPIRYDLKNYQMYIDYELKEELGRYESFEREYYDLIRGGFMKYGFQLKIGGMNGALIAYHNTKQIFGVEYIKTGEIMKRIFGNEFNSDIMFIVGARMMTTVLDYIRDNVKEDCKAFRVGFYANSLSSALTVFVECCQQDPAEEPLIQATEQIKDEYDYYTKFKKFTNKLIKLEFVFTVVVNGVTQLTPYLLNPGDDLQVFYHINKKLSPTFVDYMNFLHESYFFANTLADYSYAGAWLRNKHELNT